jgi:TldD protein
MTADGPPSRSPLLDGFDDATLTRILATALGRGGDYADVFFERREESSLRLEDGVLRAASAGTTGGVGVRVLSGEKTGYAFTEERTPEAVLQAARTAAAIAQEGRDVPPIALAPGRRRDLYRGAQPALDASPAGKVAWLERADRAARAVDPRVRSVFVSLAEELRRIVVVSSAGVMVDDVQPMTSFRVFVVAEENGVRTTGMGADSARRGPELLAGDAPERIAKDAAGQAVRNQSARPAPAGATPVVLGCAESGILLHEAVGHGLEADFNRKGVSRYSGQVGKSVASKLVTVVDDGTIASQRGSLNVDDEGNPSGETVLIEDGILRGYLQDRLSARLMGVPATGNGRRQGYASVPMPRMTNTFLRPGAHDPEEILRSVKRGVYAVRFGGGQVEIGKGDFMFVTTEAWLIEDGKLTAPLRDVTLLGNGPEVMSRVEMVGNDASLSDKTWTCGKDGQDVPVGVGMPTVKISSMTIGGTE